MKKLIMKKLILTVFILLLSAYSTGAEVLTCSDCSLAEVQSKVTKAVSGDTVVVPACETTIWYNQFIVDKSINLIGAGAGVTNIICRSGANVPFIKIIPDSENVFRLSGFTFDGQLTNDGLLLSHQDTKEYANIRIDHNEFLNFQASSPTLPWTMMGTVRGVVDNNLFTGYPHFDNSGSTPGKYDWENRVYVPGDPNSVYYEDNVIRTQTPT